jgi:hypothetical protein
VRVNADRGVDVRMAIGERDGGTAGDEIATDRHERTHPCLACPLDRRFAIGIVANVIQMGMGIDEHADHLRVVSDETMKLSGRSGDDALGQFVQQSRGIIPAKAGIGDRDAMDKCHALFPGLFAGIKIAFKHQAHDR